MTDDVIRDKDKPLHIGLIPDGNRRYALKYNKNVWEGHWKGVSKIKNFITWCLEYPEIKRISIFALSTENLNRPDREVDELWKIYKAEFEQILSDPLIRDNSIRVKILGNNDFWKNDLKATINNVVNSTKHYSKHILNILLAYGSKFEINNAVMKLLNKPVKTLDKFLLVKEPLDLIIRTGKQHRLSNFMLYQASYAEIFFSDKLWPEFTKKEFQKIMKWYFKQQEKFGK